MDTRSKEMSGKRRVVELYSEEVRRSEDLRPESSLDGRLEEDGFLEESGRERNTTVPYHFFYRETSPREVKTLLGIGAGMLVYSLLPQQVRNVSDHVLMPIVAGGSAVLLTYLSIRGLDGLYNRLFDKPKDSNDR